MHILESHFSVWNVAKDSSVLQHHLRVMEDCSEIVVFSCFLLSVDFSAGRAVVILHDRTMDL